MIHNNMAFEERIRQMIAETKSIGYNPTYFIRMVQELGAVTACKQLINNEKLHDGLCRLWKEHRLDLTIENIILEPQWAELFSESERTLAKNKLLKLSYKGETNE